MQNSGLYLRTAGKNLLRHGRYTSVPCDIICQSHYQKQPIMPSKIRTVLRIRRNLIINKQPRFLRPTDFDMSQTSNCFLI